jgi:penicillin-binding protein 2
VVRQIMDAWLLTEDGKLKPEYGGTPSSVEATALEE